MAAGLDAAQGVGGLRRARRLVGGALFRPRWLKGIGLLAPAVGAFGFFYIAALVLLFVSAFWGVDAFTGELVHKWTTDNFHTLVHESTYRTVALRTIGDGVSITANSARNALVVGMTQNRMEVSAGLEGPWQPLGSGGQNPAFQTPAAFPVTAQS